MIDALEQPGFTEEQKYYLDGFVAGGGIRQSLHVLPTWQQTLPSADPVPANFTAEEKAKHKLNGLDTWDLVLQHARDARFPRRNHLSWSAFRPPADRAFRSSRQRWSR